MRLRLRSLVLALALVLSGTQAFAAFTYYKAVTYASAQAGTADSTNYPLLVSLSSDSGLNTHARSDGHDIRPYLNSNCSTGVMTAFQLVYYATGTLEMWVSISTLSHTADGTFYLCYGDNAVSGDGSSNTTWNSNYGAVWHVPDGTTLGLSDSTANANTLTNHSASAATGVIDGGVSTTAGVGTSTQYLTAADAASLKPASAVTISAWVKPTAASEDNKGILGKWKSSAQGYMIYLLSGVPRMYVDGIHANASTALSSTSTWYHLVGTWDGSTATIYVNGTSEGTAATSTLTHTTELFAIATYQIGAADQGQFGGVTDEGRVLSVAVSQSWITADYNSQKPSQTMVTYGSETATGGGGATTSPTLPLLGAGPG